MWRPESGTAKSREEEVVFVLVVGVLGGELDFSTYGKDKLNSNN